MKITNIIIIAVVALCAALTGTLLVNFSNYKTDKAPHGFHTKIHQRLDLNAEQEIRLQEIERTYLARKAELEAQLIEANAALAITMETDKSLTPDVQVAIDDFHAIMGQLQKETIMHIFAMRAVLTEEQAILFDAEVARTLTDR